MNTTSSNPGSFAVSAPVPSPGGSAIPQTTGPSPAQLLAVWQETLGISAEMGEMGVDENFFEAGGTSLLAARLAGRLQAQLGCAVTAADILAHPTVRQLAQKLGGQAPGLDRAASERRAAMQRGAFTATRRGR